MHLNLDINIIIMKTSVVYSTADAVKQIVGLYIPSGRFVYDATYNRGNFWVHNLGPEIMGDIKPLLPEIKQIDCTNTGFQDSSIESIAYDPPFIVGPENTVMAKMYGYFNTVQDMFLHIDNSLQEFKRIMKNKGVLMVKIQDFTKGSQNYFPSIRVINSARDYGFQLVDIVIKVNKKPPKMYPSLNNSTRSMRKVHTYFYVFRKNTRRIRVEKF